MLKNLQASLKLVSVNRGLSDAGLPDQNILQQAGSEEQVLRASGREARAQKGVREPDREDRLAEQALPVDFERAAGDQGAGNSGI